MRTLSPEPTPERADCAELVQSQVRTLTLNRGPEQQSAGGSGRESISRNVGFSFVISVISAVFSTALLIYLTRAEDSDPL